MTEPLTQSLAAPSSEGTVDHQPTDGPGATTAPDAASGPLPPPSSSAQRYELLELIARGGMGEVFAARDHSLHRVVAVKLLREDIRDRPQIVARFLEEARITGQFQHPGIPPIHDLGTLPDDRPFIAMKLIQGRTLADLLATDGANRASLLQVFEQIAQTVAYAHSKRVIHRDLKPANVMVGAFGEVQVMDWGLAKTLLDGPALPAAIGEPFGPAPPAIETDREAGTQTQSGTLLGTPAYMPPEQARGEIERLDARADVFALGAILCELLTGKPPYTGKFSVVRALAMAGQVDPALERLASCGADPELVGLARRCLAAEPDDRPAHAGEVARAITDYRAGVADRLRQAEVERAEAVVREAESRKRRRAQFALVAAAALLLLGGGAVAWWADRQATDRRAEKLRLEQEKQAEAARFEAERTATALRQQVEEEKRAQTERERLARNAQAIESLLGQGEAGLRAFNPDLAALPLAQLDRRYAEGGAENLKPRIDRCRDDLAMLRDLDRADDVLWAAEDYQLRSRRSIEAFTRAFEKYGIVLGQTSTADAARRVTTSQLRDRLLQALDLWYIHHTVGRRPPALQKLLEAADPDPFRNEVRNAVLRSDAGWNQAIVEDPKAFEQPAWFAAAWAQATGFPPAARERILRKALDRSPNDFALLLTMFLIQENATEFRAETANQQMRWAQAAVSVRPQSKVGWRNLGRAYWDKGQIEDAVGCYRKACRLDAGDYNSWSQLSTVLLRSHDPEAALEAVQKALALSPGYALAHSALGSVYERQGDFDRAREHFEKAIEIDQQNGVESNQYHNNLGYALLQKGELDRAIRCFRESLRIRPDFQVAQTNLTSALGLKTPQPAEAAPPPREKDESKTDGKKVRSRLRLTVPQNDAELRIEGKSTRTTGVRREFETPEIEPDRTYQYGFSVTWRPNNYTVVTRTQAVELKGEELVPIDLTKSDPKSPDKVLIRWRPIPHEIVREMIGLAGITPADVVYEPGPGDGRVLMAAVKAGARKAVGIELDPKKAAEATEKIRDADLADRVRIQKGDALVGQDFREASVVFLYTGTEYNNALRPILEKQLKPGTRIVSQRFRLGDWPPDKTITVTGTDEAEYVLHLWTVKDTKGAE